MSDLKREKKDQISGLSRRELRVLALQVLYSAEFHSLSATALKKSDFFSQKELLSLEDSFVQERVKGIQKLKEKLDQIISELSENWKKERMSLIDLNIMRMAVFEILFCEEIPDKSALNEALELSKKFGDDNSSRFINGILNPILQDKKRWIEEIS